MRTAVSVFPRPGLDRPPPETFAGISQTEVYAASKELVFGVFGEQVFRIGYRLRQTKFIQCNITQVNFNLSGYLRMQATCFGL